MSRPVDPRSGAVQVTVDGKDWTLLMDFNALCDLTQAAGEDGIELMTKVEKGEVKDPAVLRLIVHCALIQTHETATLRDAGRILSVDPEALFRASAAAFPAEDADDAGAEDVAPGEAEAAQE